MFDKLVAGMKGVLRKMGLLRTLKDIKEHKKIAVSDSDYTNIDLWKSEYMNTAQRLNLSYKHNGNRIRRHKRTLKLPKITARYMSKLVFNEKATFEIDDKGADEFLKKTLDDNGFYKNFKRYLEYGMALGGFVMKVYHDGNKNVKISYATADAFYPLSNDSEHIDECVIPNSFQKGDKFYTLLEWNEWEDDKYVVTNELYESYNANEIGNKVPLSLLYKDLKPRVEFDGLSRPFFVYLKPNIANNFNLTSPLGISVYANATDTIDIIDTMYDSFEREFVLGKKRIMVPSSMIKTTMKNGEMIQYFDTEDEAFHVFNSINDDAKIIADVSVEIRAEEFISSINAMLKIFAVEVGLSAGTFTFDENGIKTATEVISEKSETFQTKNEHSLLVDEALKELFISIIEVGKLIGAYEGNLIKKSNISIDFDDSIADDDDTRINRWTNAKNQGMVPLIIALQRAHKITEKEAELWVKMIRDDEQAGRGITDVEASQLFGGIEE
ncbi:phage portal protein [Listeria booriae]|nr:phage portal protein [Listeria booriae]MBC6150106.1 phage portal protein [Listeria booriae]